MIVISIFGFGKISRLHTNGFYTTKIYIIVFELCKFKFQLFFCWVTLNGTIHSFYTVA